MTAPDFTAERAGSICTLVGLGVDVELAAATEGVDATTIRQWLTLGRAGTPPYAEFARDIDTAQAEASKRLTLNIVKRSNDDWRAAAWFLQNRAPDPATAQPTPPKAPRKLTPRMRAFVREFIVCRNGAEAARRAGYSKGVAREQAYQLLRHPNIQSALREAEEAEDRLVGSRRHYVLNRLRDLAERSMAAEPVRDANGVKVGVYKQDGPTAARALELLGKHEGLFNDRIDVRVQGEVESLLEGVRALMTQQAYAELVRAIAEITGVARVGDAPAEGDGASSVH